VWRRLLAACRRHPRLVSWVKDQLERADPAFTDDAEVKLWKALARDPTFAALERLAAGGAVGGAPSVLEAGGPRPARTFEKVWVDYKGK
jgi:hypothetical protein